MTESETVAVVSYNMSFASDETGSPTESNFASEWTFLSGNKEYIKNEQVKDLNARRNYWKNALSLLEKFIKEQHKNKISCIIGLQEMNETVEGSGTGTDAVNKMLEKLNSDLDTSYLQIVDTDMSKPGAPTALSIIYDTAKFGKPQMLKNNKNHDMWSYSGNGRPRMLVITENYDVFITMHGANFPNEGRNRSEFNTNMEKANKIEVQTDIDKILKENRFSKPNNIFLMGDLNDRYDTIKEFEILGQIIKYSGEAPKSCCHNWDSSCTADRFNREYSVKYTDSKENKKFEKGKLSGFDEEFGTCSDDPTENRITSDFPRAKKDNKGNKILKKDGTEETIYLKVPMPGEEGFTKNYRYRGDKVFGIDPIDGKSEIKIYQGQNGDGVSVESDHEMVYAFFNIRSVVNVARMVGKIERGRGGRKRRTLKHRLTRKKHKSGKRRTKKRGRRTRRKA